jgi:hypothetical protein
LEERTILTTQALAQMGPCVSAANVRVFIGFVTELVIISDSF